MSKTVSTRRSSREIISSSLPKRPKSEKTDLLSKCLQDSGLILKHPPEKSIASQETILIIRQFKKQLQQHVDYPSNINDVFRALTKDCQNIDVFKHYLFPNIVRQTEDSPEQYLISDSVIKILLNVPILQNKLIEYVFEKAMDLALDSKCSQWIQMILKCISSLDNISNTEKISSNLVNLLEVSNEKMVKLEIITAIPDIVGDQEHENIANEMSRILSEEHDLIPAILDCLSYLCLSDEQYELLQTKALSILNSLTNCCYYANFVKFLLMPSRVSESSCFESVLGLRNALSWPSSANSNDLATSQVLTASAIRNTIISSKTIANAWSKVVSSNKSHIDHKPIDIIILVLLYSTTEERKRQVENIIRKQLKFAVLKEELLNEAFNLYKPMMKEYLRVLIELANSLFKVKTDPLVEIFVSHFYTLLYSELEECRQTVIAELLQLGLDRKQCVMNILTILNNVAAKDMSMLKQQSLQMLTLLDRMDDMNLPEIKGVMNIVCGLAYSFENSIIRDDIHMIIRKELGSSTPNIKIQGILAGVYAVKYLIAFNSEDSNDVEMPDDISYSSVTYLAEGPLREAAQIIELISRSTRHFPDMIAFFYDEMSEIMSKATVIHKQFLYWLTDAVTNDLQQNFIVDSIATNKIGQLSLSMMYGLNADSEMDEMIAINIAGLVLESNEHVNVGIISSLFQLVQTLHYKQHDGNLSTIDALLGCAVVMPKFDVDLIEEMDQVSIFSIMDCLFNCANWFRELLNAFATQNDEALKSKLLHRIVHIDEIASLMSQILMKSKINYRPPPCIMEVTKYCNTQIMEKKLPKAPNKPNSKKQVQQDESTLLPDTAKTQATQNISVKNKLDMILNIPLRPLSLKVLNILTYNLSIENDIDSELNVRTLNFLLKCIISNIEKVLISKIKKKTFLTKDVPVYDQKSAEECAQKLNDVLPKILDHLKIITSFIENSNKHETTNIDETGFMFTDEIIMSLDCLDNLFKMLTIYFKWIGFKGHNGAILKSSLRTLACQNNEGNTIISLKELLLNVAKFLQNHEKYCYNLTTAISLLEFLVSIQEHSDSSTIQKIMRDMAHNFLCQQWKSLDGIPEKGLYYNQCIDRLTSVYLINTEVLALKNIIIQLTSDIDSLKSKNDVLESFKCINKGNFPILYRNLGSAMHEAAKARLNKDISNAEHLEVWKEIVNLLKLMSDIAKKLETRNNLSAFFKKSLPILKLFMAEGMPVIETQFKNNTEEVLEIFKILQQSTRFLQSLCCHSRLKKDAALMAKVPFMRQLLETLIYKVKAALAANKCSEAFWMGNLKNKNIHGEIIATQQSIDSEESVEDGDDQLPLDDSDDSEDEMINPESKSLSDVL